MKIQTLGCELARPVNPNGKLVVVLHGRGDSSAGFHWMPRTLALEGVTWLLVNAPDPWYGGYSWYEMPPDHGPGVLRSRKLLDALFQEITTNGFRNEDIVLFGFSQGCLLTLEWGGRTERKLAGCIGISGYCYDARTLALEVSLAAKSRPWLVTHGYQDEVLSYEVTAAQIRELQDVGMPIDFRAYAKTHTIGPDLQDIRDALQGMFQTD